MKTLGSHTGVLGRQYGDSFPDAGITGVVEKRISSGYLLTNTSGTDAPFSGVLGN